MNKIMQRLLYVILLLWMPSVALSQAIDSDEENYEPYRQQSKNHILVGGCFSIPISDFSNRAGLGFGFNLGTDLGVTRYIDFSMMANYSYWLSKSESWHTSDVASISYQTGFKLHITSATPAPYFGFVTGIRRSYGTFNDTPNWLFTPIVGCELGNLDKNSLCDISGTIGMDDKEFAKIGINISVKIGL